MQTRRGALALAVLVVPLVSAFTLVAGAGTAAAADGEQIRSYDIQLTLRPDASMHVREAIAYDFSSNDRHGIWRKIPDEFSFDEQHSRMYPITNVKVSSPDAPADVQTEDGGSFGIRIGDPDRTISGVRHYVIDYDVAGVVNNFSDHQELYWNAIGTEWAAPIDSAKVVVQGPAGVQKVACFRGDQGSKEQCGTAKSTGDRATFADADLRPSQAMSVVVAFPAGTFPKAAPILSAVGVVGGGEQIRGYDIRMTLRKDASMHVQETIAYDFANSYGKHGIWRKILDDFSYDEKYHRVYPITNVDVSSPDAPDDTETDDDAAFGIKVGDKDETVSGLKHYVINYDVGGVVNNFPDHQELYWNAIGSEWSVPISVAKVVVEGPAGVQRVACFRGFQGSTEQCGTAQQSGDLATFTARALQPGQGMSVVVSFPAGTFPHAAPILREPWSVQRAFSVAPLQAGTAVVALLLLIMGAIRLVLRHGRDEEYLGQIPGLEPGLGQQENVRRRSVFGRTPVAVQFQPPKGMRPGQLGTLIDEQANVVDVTATIVDLAVRGLLRIEEIQKPGFFRGGDWKLVRQSGEDGDLHAYERTLLNAIFSGRDEVLLSDLKQTFRADLQKVQSLLYRDVTENGWFRGNPNSVRVRWQFLGLLAIAAGAGLTYVLARWTSFGLTGIAVGLAGVVLLAMSPRMPARTAKGTAALAQARGFRLYLETAEAEQLKFEEGEDLFSRYLPYAIVFGVAERWAKVFARLAASGVAVESPTWYVSSNPAFYGNGFDYNGFGGSMNSFADVTSGSLAAATPSSSGSSGFGGGGFSGGGGGGGGGGSW